MALDDYLEPEVLIAVGVTAALASPEARRVIRKGLVYGLAALLTAGDRVKSLAQGVAQSAQQATEEGTERGGGHRAAAGAHA